MASTAVEAALTVARRQGVRCDDPVVLRASWHVLVHLRPSAVVARVSSSLPYPEGPDPECIVRELAVAGHCARAGCAVVPPAAEIEPVPYYEGGHVLAFWRYVEPHAAADPCEAVRALRDIHDALADFEGALPPFGHPAETDALLAQLPRDDADVDLLRELVATRPAVDGQALHGDAHLFNVLGSPDGPVWHDFETACYGPREYDLAALEAEERAFYGPYDHDLLEAMQPHYLVWVTASMMVAQPRRPELAPHIRELLRELRGLGQTRR